MMTKVLFVTNKADLTTDFVVREIQKKGARFYRLNTEDIGISVLLSLDFKGRYYLYDQLSGEKHDLESFSAVYFRRPAIREYHEEDLTEAEIQFLRIEQYQSLEGIYRILDGAFWISPLNAIRNAENKIYQQILASKIGLQIAPGIITNNPDDFRDFLNRNDNDCIVKSIRSGQVGQEKTEKIAYTSKLVDMPSDEQIMVCPSYIQKHIDKECDIRVTVVGKNVFATAILSQGCDETKTDWRKGEHVLPYHEIELPKDVEHKCLQMMKILGLNYGAIDFILDKDGNYVFLEINPNGQWAWIECRTGYRIAAEIANLLIHGEN